MLKPCTECGQEMSTDANACPHCGKPNLVPPPVERKVVPLPPNERNEGFPPWGIALIGLLTVAFLVIIFLIYRQSEGQEDTSVNVNLASKKTTATPARDTTVSTVPTSSTAPVSVPPGQTTTVPGSNPSAPVQPPSDKGSVVINAQVVPAGSRSAQPARGTKFYLLDKDLETVLSEARVEPIEGNTLSGSLGLAAIFPDKYGEFQRNAMRAIGNHVKYSGTTGGDGSATLGGVNPNNYYLFAITRVGKGFALWNSPVSVVPGENALNLSPQPVTEVSGEN